MIFNLSKILPKSLKDTENLTSVQTNWYTPEVVYRRIAKTTRRCIKNSMLMISVIFKILLNSIVCFLHISSSYFRVRGIIKVKVFSRFYDSWKMAEIWIMDFFILPTLEATYTGPWSRNIFFSSSNFDFWSKMHLFCLLFNRFQKNAMKTLLLPESENVC